VPSVSLDLRDDEVERLRKPVVGSGGYQCLLHRLQRGLHGATLRVAISDFERIVTYWCSGKGGFQRRFPLRSLSPYLRTAAPLLGARPATLKAQRWIYFVQDREHRVKIGGTFDRKRRGGGRRTDNADPLTLLLWLPEGEAFTERGLHARFAHLRIHADQEWFWFGDDIKTFIDERKTASAELLEATAS
jgi:hypothetical protein